MPNFKLDKRKTNVKWIFAIAFTLFFQLMCFAQDPTDFGGGTNPTDAPVVSIDGSVWVLMGVGIAFAFYKKAINTQNKENGVS